MNSKTIALSILTVLALVACDKSRSNVTGTLSAGNQPKLGANGTIDSGGCNGFEKGCLESYAKDITTLPEYQKVVMPISKKLLILDNTPEELESLKKDGVTDALDVLTKTKVWYFVPTNLAKIPNDKLGVAFSTEQLALQSRKEIWIDAKKYAALSEQGKGELLLHEVMMAGYLTKYMTMAEVAQAMSTAVPNSTSSDFTEYRDAYDKANPVPKFKGLTKEDNENIRGMTRFLLDNASSMTKAQYNSAMKNFGFPGADDIVYDQVQNSQSASFGGKTLREILELAKKSGNMPNQCLVEGRTSPVPCQVSWTIFDNQNSQNAVYKNFDLSIQYQGGHGEIVVRKARGFLNDSVTPSVLNSAYGIEKPMAMIFIGSINDDNTESTSIGLNIQVTNESSDHPIFRLLGFTLQSNVCVTADNDTIQSCAPDKNNLPISAAIQDVQFKSPDIVNYMLMLKAPNF